MKLGCRNTTGWLVAVLFLATTGTFADAGAPVNTTSGLISGHAASNSSCVLEYLGIPYAQPPVGQLRFAPPQPYSSSAPFDASSYSASCAANAAKPVLNYPNHTAQEVQIVERFAEQDRPPMSEDCLTLNVWSKATRKTNKPVMVFIYGGRFNIGNTQSVFYNGQYLANAQDVVVVTFNYRVNIFGFPGVPSLPQNPGLLDQRLAVEWVRDNIAGFGGDPSKITLFGQSAGGASVDYWSYAWRDDPIVHGLISESGTARSFRPYSPAHTAEAFYNVSQLLGCKGTDPYDPALLPCVRSQNTTAVLAALAKLPPQPSKALPPLPFQPTVDNVTVFADYAALGAAGAFAPLPYFAGSNDYEFGYYAVSFFAANISFSADQINVFNLEAFTCPTAAETAVRAQNGVPVWRYSYFGRWPNLRLYPGSGAYHGSELGIIFGTAPDISGLPNTQAEDDLTAYMMGAWAKFASDPQSGLRDDLGWPVYDPAGATLVRLGYRDQVTTSFVNPDVYDARCAALAGDQSGSTGAF